MLDFRKIWKYINNTMNPPPEAAFPRFWPILYILNKNLSHSHHFFLQKYIYLSKVEAKIPIKYIFQKNEHGPYCIDIKTDAKELASIGLINMELDTHNNKWDISITGQGREQLAKILKDLKSDKLCKKMDSIVEKYKNYSVSRLESFVYKNYIKSQDETDLILANIKETIWIIRNKLKDFPPSYNLFLILGSLEYCLVASSKIKSKDVVQHNYFISVLYDYVSALNNVYNKIGSKKECLAELDMHEEEDFFYFIQQICKEIGNFANLEDTDLSEFVPQ